MAGRDNKSLWVDTVCDDWPVNPFFTLIPIRPDTDLSYHRGVACEAAGMAPMLAKVADLYGTPVMSSGGFDSLTVKYNLAKELCAAGAAVETLHLGDFDPSGQHMFTALFEDVAAMVSEMGHPAPNLRVLR